MNKTEPINIHEEFAAYFPGFKPWAYALSEALSEGSICIAPEEYINEVNSGNRNNPCINEDNPLTIESLNSPDYVANNQSEKLRPFIYGDGGLLYMQRYHAYQAGIATKIKTMIGAEAGEIEGRKSWLNNNKELINRIFSGPNHSDGELPEIERIDWQKVAAINACLHNFSIITGGPGTGKTTTVTKILAILYSQNPDLKLALAAPTGKAAARLGESLRNSLEQFEGFGDFADKMNSLVPKTIHRLLEPIPNSTLFRRNSNDPLALDLIIIDEASMVDAAIMNKLLDAIVPESRIIFLGDMNQLASVEAGSIFGDLCKTQKDKMNFLTTERLAFCNGFLDRKIPAEMTLTGKEGNILSEHIIQLYRNYRTESTGIMNICRLIIGGKEEELAKDYVDNQQIIVSDAPEYLSAYDNAEHNLKRMVMSYIDYIVEPDITTALKKLKSFRVLCAIREGENGIYKMNRKIEQILKNSIKNMQDVSEDLFNPSGTFYHNQIIMITSNNYDLDVFNGDIGLIRRKSDDDPTLVAWFESGDSGSLKEILPGYLNDWETVYAMTIHKSQGSEFDSVAVILPESEKSRILNKELLYTAASRAKKNLLIKSSSEVLTAAIQNQVRRTSGIQNCFNH